jgi:hypothetical protein
LSETAFTVGIDIGLLSKFEHGIANLTRSSESASAPF